MGQLLVQQQDSSVNMALTLRSGRMGFDSWQGQEIFLFSTASGLVLGPHPASYLLTTEDKTARR
jgi:hypothetical protein